MRNMRHACLLSAIAVLAASTIVGCKDEPPPACVPAVEQQLDKSPLTMTANVRMDRVGNGFSLIALSDDNKTIRWGRLAGAKITQETTLTLPTTMVMGPWFGLATKDMPGDQLLVVFVASTKAGVPVPPFEFQVVVQGAGTTATTGSMPRSLIALPTSFSADMLKEKLRVAMATSNTAKTSILTWGFLDQPVQPQYLVLKADAVPTRPDGMGQPVSDGNPDPSKDKLKGWSCLGTAQSRSDNGVWAVVPKGVSTPASWYMFEFRDDGTQISTRSVQLHTATVDCPVASAPSLNGYVIAWQNVDGTFFADYDANKMTVNVGIVAGSVRFGGHQSQPRIGGVASVNYDFAIAFDRAEGGGLIWRFTAFGEPKDNRYYLRTDVGKNGPMSSWSGDDALYLTYLDSVPAKPADNQRYFVKMNCPLDPGKPTLDGGPRDAASPDMK